MKYIIAITILIFISISFAACTETNNRLNGNLIVSSGGDEIDQITLNSLDRRSIWRQPSFSMISSLVPLDKNRALFSTDSGNDSALYELNISLKKARHLRYGKLVSYLPENEIVFFYEKDEKSGTEKLFRFKLPFFDDVVPIETAPAFITLENGIKFRLASPPVAISSHEVVYVGENKALKIYDSRKDLIIKTGISNCRPQAYRKATDGLICSNYSTWDVFEINLKDMSISTIDGLNGSQFIYLPEVDKLVYSKQIGKWVPLPHEISKVFLFDLKTNKETELGDGHIAHGYWLAP